ncbi:MAG: adenylate/guanylate cyclase domain-containing protein [Hormoscilla sp.]
MKRWRHRAWRLIKALWHNVATAWVHLSTTDKLTPAFAALLLLIVLVSMTGLLALKTVRTETDAAIITSVEIQRQVIAMDKALQKARQIERDFFLRWSTNNLDNVTQLYLRTHQNQINKTIDISGGLQKLLAGENVSDALRRSNPEVVSYVELVKQYSDSFNDAVRLVGDLSMDDIGLMNRLQQNSSLLYLKLQLVNDRMLLNLYEQLKFAEKEYLLTRQQSEKEKLFEIIAQLRSGIISRENIDVARQKSMLSYLEAHQEVAQEVSELDANIRSRITSSDDRAAAVSNKLIDLANEEILRAQKRIAKTSELARKVLLGAMLVALVLAVIIGIILRSALKQLEEEQKKSERLLLNILPKPIAERLKRQEQTIADDFAEVTVLFADIVGFTKLSSQVTPIELVKLLNRIFSAFDQLADKHGLEKIKTIGDAYMVVGGLPVPREDHASAIARMALDMQKVIAQFNAEQAQYNSHNTQTLKIRIGINTGPVVAGVIGVKKFIYDLWGDTVNIASRMESHGIAGYIQVSEATYEHLKENFRCKPRGAIEVKGKGEMLTYILIGPQLKNLAAPQGVTSSQR